MSLTDIFCQDRAVDILQRAYAADRSAHAYIFAGIEGIGKFKTAGEWAKLLLCRKPTIAETDQGPFADSCGECDSCRLFDAGSHPDFQHVYKELIVYTKDGKDKKNPVDLPIDVVREFLIAKAPVRPTLSARKVFVVSEAEKLNASSQNALLKVLEEPPAYCCIVLLCTRTERLLPTTRSRCQTIRFGPIDEAKIAEHLRRTGLDKSKSLFFARLAQGSLGLARQWGRIEFDHGALYQAKTEMIDALVTYDLADSVDFAQRLIDYSKAIATAWADLAEQTSTSDLARRAHQTVIKIVIAAFHDAMRLSVYPGAILTHSDQKPQIKRLAGRIDGESAARRIETCYQAIGRVEASVNEKLVFEQLLLSLADSAILKGSR